MKKQQKYILNCEIIVNVKLYIPLVGSAICFGIGGLLLIHTVPLILSIGTLIAIILFLFTSYLIYKGKKIGFYLGFLFSLTSILSSIVSYAHDKALLEFGSSIFISILDILMILGFYFFPFLYIILFAKELIRSFSNN